MDTDLLTNNVDQLRLGSYTCVIFCTLRLGICSLYDIELVLFLQVIMGVFGTMAFFKVEWEAQRIFKQSRRDIVS